MGMFDDLTCKYPLPVEGANELDFQTKDMDCLLTKYELREDGTLWVETYDTEDQSPATKWEREHPGEPAPPEASGLLGLCGCMSRVNKRWERVTDITGEIRFYTNDWPQGWIEFSSYFVSGQLKELNLIKNGD